MILTLALIFFAVVVLYYWINVIYDRKRLGIPGPFPLPIVGNGHLFGGDSTDFLNTLGVLTKKYGGVSLFYILNTRFLIFTDLKHIEALATSTELITKGRSYDFLHQWLGRGLLTSTGHRWKMHRKFLTPAFHFSILHNFLPIFQKNNKILIDKLRTLANGTEISLFPVIALNSLDNVAESIMGVPINSQTDCESEYVKAIGDLSEILAYRMRSAFASIDAIFNLMPKKRIQDNATDLLHKHSRHVIETRRRELQNLDIKQLNKDNELGIKNRHAFLDLLLLAELDGKKIDEEHIREEVDTFLFEGHDTTTVGIVFTLYCLSKHREIQEKVLKEQREILGDDIERDPTFSELQQMKYLDLVIKEALRLYPPVPLFERMVTRDTEIAGTFVPKNTSVTVDIFHMHRDPELYEDPLEFRPERFESHLKNPFSWLAFSAGPRNCIGQKFALLELKTVVSGVVRHFKILPSTSQTEVELGSDIVMRTRNGVFIQLRPR